MQIGLRGHTSVIWGIAFSPDGTRIATASNDFTAKVWDAGTGRELFTLNGHNGVLSDIAFSPDGTFLATAGYDRTVKLWDAITGQELKTLYGHTDPVESVAVSADGRLLLTASESTVRLYLLRIQDLVALARTRVTRSLTIAECQQYLHLQREQCVEKFAPLIPTATTAPSTAIVR